MSRCRCRCRCRCGRGCRCCPRRCRVLAGDSDYRVLHGVDVLGHCVKRGVGGRLAHRVLHGVDVLFGHRALRALAGAATTAPRRCERWRQRCVSHGSGTVHRKTERDGMMGLPNALYCDKVTSMIFSEEHIAHSSATALAKANAGIAVVLGSCAVMSQHLAQKCMSACAVMSEHLAQGCFDLAAVASQHWAQRSHCVVEFASITYRY